MVAHRFLALFVAFGLPIVGVSLRGPRPTYAYETEVHDQLSKRGLQGSGVSETAGPLNLIAAGTVRSAIDTYARRSPTFHDAWVKRYPRPGDFDDWAFKYFLLFEPNARVYGIDRLDERLPANARYVDIIAQGSRQPDDDWRNRERLAYGPKRVPLKDGKGGAVPADPALLNMGMLGTLSSQAHAHYGLAQVVLSDDPEVLKKEPRRFAKKIGDARTPILTLAAEMAEMHLDLALIAALSDAPSARELSWLYTGQGFHYLQDVGNQIHTVQVGLYQFFVDGGIERLKLGLLTFGGYLGRMRSLGSIGVDILTNHHVLSEHLTQKRLIAAVKGGGDADGQKLLLAPALDDPEFAARLDAAMQTLSPVPERGEFGLTITRTLIEVSSHEGEGIYRTTREIADPRLRTRNGKYDETRDDPDDFLLPRKSANEAAYQEFFTLQERAFRRVGTAMRRWVALQQKVMAIDNPDDRAFLRAVAMERLIARQLRMLDAQEARLSEYLLHPLYEASQPEHSPALLAVDIGLIALLNGAIFAAFYVIRRRKARANAAG